MSKPLFRFEKNSLKNTISVMDGDGTVYKPFIRCIRLVKRTKLNYKNPDGSFDLDGLLGRPLVIIKK